MFSQEIFSERFSALRKESKMNQAQIAEILGISQAAISKIEKGERAASIEVFCALADHFGVSLDFLVGHSDDPQRH